MGKWERIAEEENQADKCWSERQKERGRGEERRRERGKGRVHKDKRMEKQIEGRGRRKGTGKN